MKFYLSSYKLGNDVEKLRKLIPEGRPVLGYIPNALDFSSDEARRARHIEDDQTLLRELGIASELLDLRLYFGMKDALRTKLTGLGGVWVSGGNTFVLRQAMRESGFDELLMENSLDGSFLYGGYSAAGCVLGPTLRAYQVADDSSQVPYPQIQEVIWEGLGLVDFAFMPHFESEHPESAAIGKEIEYCRKNNIPFKAVRDGDIIVIE